MKAINKFKEWAETESFGRRLLCHFYFYYKSKKIERKQYYDDVDYAYFNLFNPSKEWIVKGTTGHGRESKNGLKSNVPLLNCIEVNDLFYDALDVLVKERSKSHSYVAGIILNKRMIEKLSAVNRVDPVSTKYPSPFPSRSKLHQYDNPYTRRGSMYPFHECDFVRVLIKPDCLGQPIAVLPSKLVKALLVKRGSREDVYSLLKAKKLERKVKVFPIL